MEDEQQVVEKIDAALPEAPIEKAEPAVKEPRKSLREELKSVAREVTEKRETADKEPKIAKAPEPPKTGRERDEQGKFAPKEVLNVQKTKETAVAPKEPVKEAAPAPEGWRAEAKAKWATLPADIQAEINRREQDMHKAVTTMDEDRSFAKEMQKTILPYMPLINQVGSTPVKAVTEMLNYAHTLQYGSAQAKGQLLHALAQRHGADMRMTPQATQQPQFQIGNLQQELQATKEQIARMPELIKQQQEEAKLQAVIEAFAADPKNAHYARVKPVMAALLSSGQAKDMQDAYDKACYAEPDIRSTLLAEQNDAKEAKRIADLKAKAGAARNASVSVKGSSANGVSPPAVKRSLREELRANLRTATNH